LGRRDCTERERTSGRLVEVMVAGVVGVGVVSAEGSEVDERYVGGISGEVFWNWDIGVVVDCRVGAWWRFTRKGSRKVGGAREGEVCLTGMFKAFRTSLRDETWWDLVC
jgi:hypothetical protein